MRAPQSAQDGRDGSLAGAGAEDGAEDAADDEPEDEAGAGAALGWDELYMTS